MVLVRPSFVSCLLQPPAPDADDEDSKYPRFLLSNKREYFDLLFDVLTLQQESLVNDAWSLLQLLPINTDIQSTVQSIVTGSEGAYVQAHPLRS